MTSINKKIFLQEVVEPEVRTPVEPEILSEIVDENSSSNTVYEESN
jgi:hypothetical protein